MALILDTNALSAFAAGDSGLRRAILGESELAIPVVVLGEYLFGIRQSRHRSRYEDWLREHLRFFLLLEIGLETAACYADLRVELRGAGTPIPSNDVWIAALVRQHGHQLVSRDAHFAAVPGIRLVSW